LANKLNILFKLVRIKLSLAVTLSALIGYIFAGGREMLIFMGIGIGVLLLSGASSVLNQMQEADYDAKMERTKNRPLAAEILSEKFAVRLFALLLLSGTILLALISSSSAIVGLITIAIYNLVYTPLKRKSGLAIIPGAVVGAFPPILGWVGHSTNFFDHGIILLAGFMFLWQVPHFLLLSFKYKDEYLAAGFKVPITSFSDLQLKLLVGIWIVSTSMIALLFPLSGLIVNSFVLIALIILNMMLIVLFLRLAFKKNSKFISTKLHLYISLYMLLFLALIAIDSFI
jgi:protoheme IX farnesyltransferase